MPGLLDDARGQVHAVLADEALTTGASPRKTDTDDKMLDFMFHAASSLAGSTAVAKGCRGRWAAHPCVHIPRPQHCQREALPACAAA